MSSDGDGRPGISRRDFVKGAAAVGAAGGMLGGGVGSMLSASSAYAVVPAPLKWDEEADLVVVGYGYGGVCAAITARDAANSVLVLEKAPTAEGGNSGVAYGSIHTQLKCDDIEDWIRKIKFASFGTVIDDATIRGYATKAQLTPAWLEKIGVATTWSRAAASLYRPAGYTGGFLKPDGTKGCGADGFAALHKIAVAKGAMLRFSTPATALVRNETTKEIIGVKATSGGVSKYYKAHKGVILATGGYENNPEMSGWFNYPGIRIWPAGTPRNTGDGIWMASAAGAKIWHMHGLEFHYLGFRKATELAGAGVTAGGSYKAWRYLFTNKYGQRFMDETKNTFHDIEQKPLTAVNMAKVEFPNAPFWMILDSAMLAAGPLSPSSDITTGVDNYARVFNKYNWSLTDNSAELAKGWFFKADTIGALAALISGVDPSGNTVTVDPVGLQATVDSFNGYATTGTDLAFARPATKMATLSTPPFYAIEMCMTALNTQGGPVHNANSQTIDTDGNPIPRLYSVGELGSINGIFYVCGNIAEALTTGRVAAEHALTLAPWDSTFSGATSISISPSVMLLGETAMLKGVATPLGGGNVTILRMRPGTLIFEQVASLALGATGAWTYAHKPTSRGVWSYKAVYGSKTSATVTVAVR